MNFKSRVAVAVKNIKKSKKFLIELAFSIIIITILLFTMSIRDSLNNYWENITKKSMDYRTFFVSYNPNKTTESDTIKLLKKYDYIEEIAPYSSYLITMVSNDYKNDKKENGFYLVGAIDTPLKIEKGNDLSRYSIQDKVMICAKQFHPYFEKNKMDYNLKNAKDLTSKVGEKMSISFIGSKEIEEFTLVGIYDAKVTNTIGNTCYTKWENVTELNLKYQPEVFEEKEGEFFPIIVVVDKIGNISKFLTNLKNQGLTVTGPAVNIDTSVGDDVNEKMSLITSILIIILSTLSILITIKTNERKKVQHSIMKVFGFSKKDLMIENIIQEFIKFILSMIISIFICLLFIKIFNTVFLDKIIIINGLLISLTSNSILIVTIISLIIPIVTSIINYYWINLSNIVEIIKN